MSEVAVPLAFQDHYQALGEERVRALVTEAARLIAVGVGDPEITDLLEELGSERGFAEWLCGAVRIYGNEFTFVFERPSFRQQPPPLPHTVSKLLYKPDRFVAWCFACWMIFHAFLVLSKPTSQDGKDQPPTALVLITLAMFYGAARLEKGFRNGLWHVAGWSLVVGGLILAMGWERVPVAAFSLAAPYLAALGYCVWRLSGNPKPLAGAPPVIVPVAQGPLE